MNKNGTVKEPDEVNKVMTKQNVFMALISILIAVAVLTTLAFYFNRGVTVKANDLMNGINAKTVDTVKLSKNFIKSQADFAVDLFKKTMKTGNNSLVSPTSVYLALAMTANGADGNTLKQFESLLGKYNLTMDDINKFCYSYADKLKDVKYGKLNIANSVWFTNDKNSLNINKNFLQTNADYFGASAYKSDFSSKQTVDDINNWVKDNTGNLIKKIVDQIDKDTVMYLINTLYFENEWQEKYEKGNILDGDFNLADGKKVTAKFMYSYEFSYLTDDKAKGFIKPYKDTKFSFVALLPDKGISVEDYAASLSGERLLSLIENKSDDSVKAGLPEFKTEFSASLVEPLKEMGLTDCFTGKSNLDAMQSDPKRELYVSDVIHKTFIQVDVLGTKAGAATKVEIKLTASPISPKVVTLNRPFVYAIIDNNTNLPIFIGTMNNPS